MDQIFDQLLVWRDPVERSGPENMAVDEVLFETLGDHPLLRFYDWDGGWVSLGYFQNLAEARPVRAGYHASLARLRLAQGSAWEAGEAIVDEKVRRDLEAVGYLQ